MARFRYGSKTRPLPQTTMHILDSDYQYLLERREFSNQPAYDILHKILDNQEKLREEFNETKEFLQFAIADKKEYRIENDKLKDRVKALEDTVKKLQYAVSAMSSSRLLLDRYI